MGKNTGTLCSSGKSPLFLHTTRCAGYKSLASNNGTEVASTADVICFLTKPWFPEAGPLPGRWVRRGFPGPAVPIARHYHSVSGRRMIASFLPYVEFLIAVTFLNL